MALRFTYWLIMMLYAEGAFSLRLLKVMIPAFAERGRSTELICDFDSETSPLYSVKWFKEDEEFFRYVPAAQKQYQMFPRVGLTVSNTSTQATRVVLRDLRFSATGQYRCEITNEGPEFLTVTGQGAMQVVEPLSSDPKLTGGKVKYKVNDTVEMACESAPSRPAAHLSWVINGKQPPPQYIVDASLLQRPDGLLIRRSRLRFTALTLHFIHGKLTIKCVAFIAPHTDQPNNFNPSTGNIRFPELSHFFQKWEKTIDVSSGSHLPSYGLICLICLTYCMVI